MGLSIHRDLPAPNALIVDRRLYLTAARDRVVEEGDPEAAFLLAAPGTGLPADMVARFGLTSRIPATPEAAAPDPVAMADTPLAAELDAPVEAPAPTKARGKRPPPDA
jgi:hypothetical protein